MATFTCSAKRGVFLVTRCLGWKVVRGWYLRGFVISRGYLMLWGKLVSVCVFFVFPYFLGGWGSSVYTQSLFIRGGRWDGAYVLL